MKRRLSGIVAAGSMLLASGTLATATAAAAPSVTLTPITDNSVCRYLNSATPPPSSWSSSAFKDWMWPMARVPFGHEEDVRTDVGVPNQTVYFRCSFYHDLTKYDPTAMSIATRVDDGAVLYFNGREVARPNMPAGKISYDTSASAVDNWDGKRWQSWPVDPSSLRQGWNHYTAEVHQSSNGAWRSSDLTFDTTVTINARQTPNKTPTSTPSPTKTPTSTPSPTKTPTSTPSPTKTPTSTPSPSDTPPANPAWKLAFADEFAGSTLNKAAWKPYHSTYGDGDPHMLHCLTPNNVAISDGTLKLNAKKQNVTCPNGKARNYSSGFVGSRDVNRYYPLFGRFEVRARTPHGQGLFPAFWLRHRNGSSAAEIDVFEAFHSSKPGTATQTLHFPTSLGYNVAKKGTSIENAVRGRGGWHTYSVDILPVKPGDTSAVTFRFAIDGATTFTYTNTKTSAWTSVDPQATWDIALQLYVGGQWAGHPDSKLGWYPASGGICSQTSKRPPNGDPAKCPTNGIWLAPWQDSTFEVDYVRVYTPA